jgi:hypothetical protein
MDCQLEIESLTGPCTSGRENRGFCSTVFPEASFARVTIKIAPFAAALHPIVMVLGKRRSNFNPVPRGQVQHE